MAATATGVVRRTTKLYQPFCDRSMCVPLYRVDATSTRDVPFHITRQHCRTRTATLQIPLYQWDLLPTYPLQYLPHFPSHFCNCTGGVITFNLHLYSVASGIFRGRLYPIAALRPTNSIRAKHKNGQQHVRVGPNISSMEKSGHNHLAIGTVRQESDAQALSFMEHPRNPLRKHHQRNRTGRTLHWTSWHASDAIHLGHAIQYENYV